MVGNAVWLESGLNHKLNAPVLAASVAVGSPPKEVDPEEVGYILDTEAEFDVRHFGRGCELGRSGEQRLVVIAIATEEAFKNDNLAEF